MIHTEIVTVQCPYCWESIEIMVDCSVAAQEYVEDCSVCCKPIVFNVLVADEDDIRVDARQENE